MPENSRYKFEGMEVDQPNAGVGSVDLGSLYSSFRGIDRTAWQLQDETIQKDLLAGATPQAGFDRYMQLAQVAGAAGDSLASVTFQQKAYSLLDAARGGRGGSGGGGGGGSGAQSVKDSLGDGVDQLKTVDLPKLQNDIKEISEAIKSGVTTPTDGLQDIYGKIAEYQGKAISLYDTYSQYLGQKGYSGIKSDLNALAKEAGIGFGANDGDGSKAVNKTLQENLYGKTVQDGDFISQVSEDFTKLSGPDGQNYVMAFVPQTSEGGLANQLSTNPVKQNGIVFTTKELAEGAKLRPVQRILGNGETVTVYINPLTSDDTLGDQLLVPTFDPKNGKTINRSLQYKTLFDENGNQIGSQYIENGKTFGTDLVIAGKESSSTNAAFPGGSMDTSQAQDNQGFDIFHPFKSLNKKGYTTNVGDLFKSYFGSQAQAAELPNPNQQELRNTLRYLGAGSLLNTPEPSSVFYNNPASKLYGGTANNGLSYLTDPQRALSNSILSKFFPDQTASINTRSEPTNNTFQSIIDSIKAKNQAAQQQAAARQAPVVQMPETPVSRSSTGLVSKAGGGYSNPFSGVKSGVQGQVSQAAQSRMDPLQLRNQASMAALNGFKSFANFIKGIF